MPDKEELLKSLITNIIDDKNEEAMVDFHKYLKGKMANNVNGETPDGEAPAPAASDDEVPVAVADEVPGEPAVPAAAPTPAPVTSEPAPAAPAEPKPAGEA